ncbi:MAG: hypothetical protein PHT41_06125 [Candidatus Omnitrophica bacterium]|nr:hypothetical protein [Candidatus Omnitrophota bacterium]
MAKTKKEKITSKKTIKKTVKKAEPKAAKVKQAVKKAKPSVLKPAKVSRGYKRKPVKEIKEKPAETIVSAVKETPPPKPIPIITEVKEARKEPIKVKPVLKETPKKEAQAPAQQVKAEPVTLKKKIEPKVAAPEPELTKELEVELPITVKELAIRLQKKPS